MNTPETLPKNVQSFIAKYSPSSREQSAAFWKEFRKAANAYAEIQGERIDKLTTERNEARKQRDELLAALEKLRDCDFVISLPDRMDAVRDIARGAIANVKGETA